MVSELVAMDPSRREYIEEYEAPLEKGARLAPRRMASEGSGGGGGASEIFLAEKELL
jgi:hypothetical protein